MSLISTYNITPGFNWEILVNQWNAENMLNLVCEKINFLSLRFFLKKIQKEVMSLDVKLWRKG